MDANQKKTFHCELCGFDARTIQALRNHTDSRVCKEQQAMQFKDMAKRPKVQFPQLPCPDVGQLSDPIALERNKGPNVGAGKGSPV